MIKHWLLALALVAVGCTRSAQFLEKVPPPPPGPPRYEKTYKFDLFSSESATVDVDIIWVIDNSGSMKDKQLAVINGSAEFMRQFTASTRLHWRMGLVSTSLYEDPYMGFDSIVDWQSPNAVGTFNAAVGRLGVDGDGDYEQSFGPILKATQDYPHFLRPGAYLVMISVSDEPEQGNYSVDEFLRQLNTRMSGSGTDYTFFGIYPPNDVTAMPGSRYYDAVQRTHGKIYNLSAADFPALMADLGKDLVSRVMSVNPVILLDQRPKPSTIQVIYRGRVLRPGLASTGGQWSYNPVANTIVVHDPNVVIASILDVKVSFVVDDSGN